MMLIDAEIMAQNRNPRWRLVRHLGIVVSSSGTTHVVLLLGYISLSNFMQIRCVVLKLWWFEFFADLAWNAYSRPRNFGFRWSEPLNEIGHHRDPQKAHPWPKPHLHANFGTDRSTGATCVRDEKRKKRKKDKERNLQWQTGCSRRSPTLTQRYVCGVVNRRSRRIPEATRWLYGGDGGDAREFIRWRRKLYGTIAPWSHRQKNKHV